MTKTILITGSTDGIGLEAAKVLAAAGHDLLLHGRSEPKLDDARRIVEGVLGSGAVETHQADLSSIDGVESLAAAVARRPTALDVLINNAGVFRVAEPVAPNGLDLRFMVNTIAPYLLTRRLCPLLPSDGRIINLSSAAQAPVDPDAVRGDKALDDSTAYAQSKLALTMWSIHVAHEVGGDGPVVVAVNPGSFLGTKMVKEAYGTSGEDIGIGADILLRASTSAEFDHASGRYFDNDARRFADPHPDALDPAKNAAMVELLDTILETLGG